MSDNVFFEQREDLKKILAKKIAKHKKLWTPYHIGRCEAYEEVLRILNEDYPSETYEKHPYLKEGSEEEQGTDPAKSYGEGLEIGYQIAKELNKK